MGALEDGAAVGDDEAGGFAATGEEAFPQRAFRLYIKCARQVVADEQFSIAYKHAGGGGPLCLSTG